MTIRRQLRLLQVYAAASFVVAAFLFLTAFTQSASVSLADANGKIVRRIPASK